MRSSIPQAIAVLLSVGTSSALDQRDEPEHENPCHSYGIDFQDNGGPYFQNISSADDFTFVSTFEGCEKDFATNIIVDPTGEQYQCTDTSLQPDNTYQMSTCPLMKNSLYSGDWSLIILGNNGDKEQFAYQRDFILTVGKPVTSTVTPTITIPAMTTPIVNSTSTHVVTDIATSTKTVTSAFTKSKTITVIPKRTTITKTKTLGTITKTAYKVMPTVTTITKTKTCSIPRRQNHQDPTCTIVPTIVQAAVFQTASSSTTPTTKPSTTPRPRRRDSAARRHAALDEDRAAFLAARSARLADSHALVIEKRGLDNSTVTITEPLTAKWQTATAWTTAAPSTMIVTVDRVTTVTSVSTKTEYKGVTKVVKTVTAPTPTKVKTKYTVIRTTSTITRRPNFTITTKSAPASSTAICKAKGGKLV